MIKMAEILRHLLRQLISKIFESYPKKLLETMEETISFHQAVFTAIKNRDSEAARMRMEEHIWDVKKKAANLCSSRSIVSSGSGCDEAG
jgi:DNA-binding GntR family transcriptional regulator